MSYICVGQENGHDINIYFKEWGSGQPIVFSHGWPLTADAWEDQMIFLAERGFRCIAHDRRGHGRSDQPSQGNTMDHYADDLAHLVKALNLKKVIHVGHSTGGGEVARYIGKYGVEHVAQVVLISAVVPLMLKTSENPQGVPLSVFDDMRNKILSDRAQFFKDLALPFYGANRPGAHVSQGLQDSFWRQGMLGGLKNIFECVKAFSETNFTVDLGEFTIPTLIIQGDDDQIVPLITSGLPASKLIKNAQLKIYPGAPHGLCSTHKQQVNADLLAFFKNTL